LLRRLWFRVSQAELSGKAFCIHAPDQLDRDVHISIGSAGDHGRREVVTLHYSQRISAPAESNPQMGLGAKSHFVGVNANEQHHVGLAIPRSTEREARAVGSGRVGSHGGTIAIRRVGYTWTNPRADTAVVRQNRRASIAIAVDALRRRHEWNDEHARCPAQECSVLF